MLDISKFKSGAFLVKLLHFFFVFLVSKSFVGVNRQRNIRKFGIFFQKPRNHVRILICGTWAIGIDFYYFISPIFSNQFRLAAQLKGKMLFKKKRIYVINGWFLLAESRLVILAQYIFIKTKNKTARKQTQIKWPKFYSFIAELPISRQ